MLFRPHFLDDSIAVIGDRSEPACYRRLIGSEKGALLFLIFQGFMHVLVPMDSEMGRDDGEISTIIQ